MAMRTHQSFRIVVLVLPSMVCKPFRLHNPCNLSKWTDMSWELTSFFHTVVLTVPYTVCQTLRVCNPCNPSKCIDHLWGPPVFFVSSFLRCLIRYARLLGSAIYPIPQNGWASYKAYPSFQHHHSSTALYSTQASLPSEFSGYLIRNPSVLRHLARVHKAYSHSEGF